MEPPFNLEVKERKTLPAWLNDAMDQAIKSSTTYFRKHGVNQLPVVILHQKGRNHSSDYVVIRFGDLEDLLEEETE